MMIYEFLFLRTYSFPNIPNCTKHSLSIEYRQTGLLGTVLNYNLKLRKNKYSSVILPSHNKSELYLIL